MNIREKFEQLGLKHPGNDIDAAVTFALLELEELRAERYQAKIFIDRLGSAVNATVRQEVMGLWAQVSALKHKLAEEQATNKSLVKLMMEKK